MKSLLVTPFGGMGANYLKIAIRNLLKNKVYSLINIGGLSLGILGSLIIYQIVKYHLSVDSFHKNAKNIYRVVMNLHLDDGKVEYEKGSPYILHKTLKNEFPQIENVAYVGRQEVTFSIPKSISGNNMFLEKEAASFISSEYFKIFDYQWLKGSAQMLDQPNNIVLTEKFAKKYFGTNDIISKTLIINNLQNLTVVGIIKDIPENTDLKTEAFISLPTIKKVLAGGGYGDKDWYYFMKSRETYILLKNDTQPENLNALFPKFSKKYYGEMSKYYQFHLQPLSDIHFNMDYDGKIKKTTINFLITIGVLLVLIACFNFINLTTAQSIKRYKEIGIRKTLGSSKSQLFWQFIIEVAIITTISIIIALFLMYLISPFLNEWLRLNLVLNQFFDLKTIFFILILAISTILFAGFYPSIIISGYNPLRALKGVTAYTKEGFWLRQSLVITQFSASFVLISVSILIVLQINFLLNKDIGSTKNLILHAKIPAENSSLFSLKNEILKKSYISNISFSGTAPSSKSGWGGSIKYENRDWEKFVARSRCADENYIDTYQIKLLFGEKPIASDTINEVLVNMKMVKALNVINVTEVLGKQIVVGDAGDKKAKIVGIVADFNQSDLYSAIEPTVIYSSKNRYRQASISLSNMDTKKTIAELKTIWAKYFPDNVFEYSFYEAELASFYEKDILFKNLVILFGFLSIFISCLGLFGLASFATIQRTKEIGIRKVLGANIINLSTLISKDFIKLILISFLLASPIAYFFMHNWLLNFAYRINISWWIFALAGLSILLITLFTISYQIIRATLISPVKSLKTE